MEYISKQKALEKGFTKKNGIIYKKSLLEIWYAKNWLEMPNSKFTAEDRLNAGLLLAADFYAMSSANLRSGYILNTKIDGTRGESASVIKSQMQNSYIHAVKVVPSEFWPVVRKICIEEADPVPLSVISERQKAYFNYLVRVDLCRGLDRLVEHYNQKLKLNKK